MYFKLTPLEKVFNPQINLLKKSLIKNFGCVEVERVVRIKMIEMRKGRKGQVKMMETMFVLVALAFLFGLVFIFYTKFQMGGIEDEIFRIEEERAGALLGKFIGMPELRCSESFGEASESNCIDLLKLLGFMEIRGEYGGYFRDFKEVRIERVFPAPLPVSLADRECRYAFNYPLNCGKWTLYSSRFLGEEDGERRMYNVFLPLCMQKDADFECVIGRLIVEV